jgi:hypothetical protein
MKYSQRDPRWKDIPMGFGTSTIGDVGCYLTSLTSGLSELGYNFDPQTLNQLLRDVHAWVGPYQNYIDAYNITKYLPDIFVSYKQVSPWNDVPPTKELLMPGLIVVCKVNAAAIGGTGTHFVLLTGIQNGVAVIWDPWSGVEEPITKRWGAYGDILDVRIFEVKIKSTILTNPPPEPPKPPETPEIPEQPVIPTPVAPPQPLQPTITVKTGSSTSFWSFFIKLWKIITNK